MNLNIHHHHHHQITHINAHVRALMDQLFKKFGAPIMTAISDFATKQGEFNDQMDAAIAAITTDVSNLDSEIATLQASIAAGSTALSPADQALLDGLNTRSQGIVAKLTALDALTPPATPAEPVPAAA